MNAFYNGYWRLDLGLGNPNKTALLLVLLIIAGWAFFYWRKGLFYLSLFLSLLLGAALLHTYSRGGLVALFLGMAMVFYGCRAQLTKSRSAAVFFAIIVLATYGSHISASNRWSLSFVAEDLSVLNRLEIIRNIPAMIIDAPNGWGYGNSGAAYMSWYQPIGRLEIYRTLVSSHLTWFVEMGWAGRLLYLFFWCLVFVCCWPSRSPEWFYVPLGAWSAFFVGAIFSSVAECLILWIIPLIALACVVWRRISGRLGISLKRLSGTFMITVIGVCGLIIGPWSKENLIQITANPKLIVLKIGPARKNNLLVLRPDSQIIGLHYGQNARIVMERDFAKKNSPPLCMGFAIDPAAVAAFPCPTLVLMGDQRDLMATISSAGGNAVHRLIFIDPLYLDEDRLRQVTLTKRIDVIIGEEFSGLTTGTLGFDLNTSLPNIKIHYIKGAGDCLPRWAEAVMSLYQADP
jgi:hypothetical protein